MHDSFIDPAPHTMEAVITKHIHLVLFDWLLCSFPGWAKCPEREPTGASVVLAATWCPTVCLLHVGVLSKWLDGLRW